MTTALRPIGDQEVLAARGAKNKVDPRIPYAFLVEPERSPRGTVQDVATIFLTNQECPFRCIYCDLWKNTTDQPVAAGDIPAQLDYALARLPQTASIKLYNSGNFFDAHAIPPADYPAIIARVQPFERVIVENHPRLCGAACVRFSQALGRELEIALGLETVEQDVLRRLNKQMTADDFRRAAEFLRENGMHVRAFIMIQPPFVTHPAEAVEGVVKSVEFAVAAGAGCCSLIPTRGGSGLLEQLRQSGEFAPPSLSTVEAALAGALELPLVVQRGARIFFDLWDVDQLAACSRCGPPRRERLRTMNDTQRVSNPVACDCEGRL